MPIWQFWTREAAILAYHGTFIAQRARSADTRFPDKAYTACCEAYDRIRGVFIDLNANSPTLLLNPSMEGDYMYRIIGTLLLVAVISPVYAQQTEVMMLNSGQITSPEDFYTPPQEMVKVKKPWIAFLLSTAIVGSGQFYNEQFGKGSAMFLGAATGIGMYFHATRDNKFNFVSGKEMDLDDNDHLRGVGAGLAFGFILWSMVDAPPFIHQNKRAQSAGYDRGTDDRPEQGRGSIQPESRLSAGLPKCVALLHPFLHNEEHP